MKSRFGNVCFTGVLTSGLYPVNVSENTYTHGIVGISGSLVVTASNLPTWWENGIVFASNFDVHNNVGGPSLLSYINNPASTGVITVEDPDPFGTSGDVASGTGKFGMSGIAKGFVQTSTFLQATGIPELGANWTIAFWAKQIPASSWNEVSSENRFMHLLNLRAELDFDNYYKLSIHHARSGTGVSRFRLSWVRSIAGTVTTVDRFITLPESVNPSVQTTTPPFRHIAIIRKDNVLRIYINGTEDTAETLSDAEAFILPNNFGLYTVRIAWNENGWFGSVLNLDDLILVSGQDVFTIPFTPPISSIIPMASGWWRNRAQFVSDFTSGTVVGMTNKGIGGTIILNPHPGAAEGRRITFTSPRPGCQGNSLKLPSHCWTGTGDSSGCDEIVFRFPKTSGTISTDFGSYFSSFAMEFWVRVNPPLSVAPEIIDGSVPLDAALNGFCGITFRAAMAAGVVAPNYTIAGVPCSYGTWYKIATNNTELSINGVWVAPSGLPFSPNVGTGTGSVGGVPTTEHQIGFVGASSILVRLQVEICDFIFCGGSTLRDQINFTPEPLGLINF